MNIAKKKFLGATLAAAVLLGAGGQAAVTAAPAHQSNVQTISAASASAISAFVPSSSNVAFTADAGSALSTSATSQGAAANSQQLGALARAAAQAIVNAVKTWGPAAWNAMVNAVKSGYSSFVNWFNSLPGWVKALSSGVSVNAIYDAIKSVLGF
jgi:hypothetical protein